MSDPELDQVVAAFRDGVDEHVVALRSLLDGGMSSERAQAALSAHMLTCGYTPEALTGMVVAACAQLISREGKAPDE